MATLQSIFQNGDICQYHPLLQECSLKQDSTTLVQFSFTLSCFPSTIMLWRCMYVSRSMFFFSRTETGGSRNSLKGGGGSGPEFFEGGGLGSRSVGIFIYWQAKKTKKPLKGFKPHKPPPPLWIRYWEILWSWCWIFFFSDWSSLFRSATLLVRSPSNVFSSLTSVPENRFTQTHIAANQLLYTCTTHRYIWVSFYRTLYHRWFTPSPTNTILEETDDPVVIYSSPGGHTIV